MYAASKAAKQCICNQPGSRAQTVLARGSSVLNSVQVTKRLPAMAIYGRSETIGLGWVGLGWAGRLWTLECSNCCAHYANEWTNDWLTDWLSECASERASVRMITQNEWMSEHVSELVNARGKRLSLCVKGGAKKMSFDINSSVQ